mmetsp:Transcript_3979/g.5042  ORF Transcript_3979/g.5042 Transcript_3979/m.5042 type:complete len:159 (-) Transcript_3979:451-927(-)
MLKVDMASSRIEGWLQRIETKHIPDPGRDAEAYLRDVRAIESQYGIGETISYLRVYRDFEVYVVLLKEGVFTLSMALAAVVCVVFFITASLRITFIVVFVVCLVNIFMLGMTYYWGLHMNMVMTLNMSFCFGVAVDYSTHIAHTYQMVRAPPNLKLKT